MPKFIVNTEVTVVRGFIVHASDWERAKRIIETRFVDDDLPTGESWEEDDVYDSEQEVVTAVMSAANNKVTFHYDRNVEEQQAASDTALSAEVWGTR
jgi:hypothetical protein